MIRKATIQDLDAVQAIYAAIHDAEAAGRTTTGWLRGVYPVRQTAEEALRREELFVQEAEGKIVAAAILNQRQGEAYARCPWRFPAPEHQVMVLHTLVVDPQAGGKGYGRAFVAYYEQWARACGCVCLRMDTNERNTVARRLYARLGFTEAGIVPCVFQGIPAVRLVCLEKKID